jgi:hypothetical protein
MRARHLIALLSTILLCATITNAGDVSIRGLPPVVVRTIPESGSLDVDPGLTEIRVTFSKEMRDQSWSCVTLSKESFPTTAGDPKYDVDKRTFVLPVKLEPGRTYALMLNSEKYQNFKDANGKAALPYILVFETRQ